MMKKENSVLNDLVKSKYAKVFPWMSGLMGGHIDNDKEIRNRVKNVQTTVLLNQLAVVKRHMVMNINIYDEKKLENTYQLIYDELDRRDANSNEDEQE